MASGPQRRPADGREGRAVPPAMLALPLLGVAGLVLVASLRAQVPEWWLERNLVSTNAGVAAADFAPANQGQLKHAASLAAEELEAALPGGAGGTVSVMVAAWTNDTAGADDYAPLNLGQLKAVAKPFYDRIIADGGWTNGYPWTTDTVSDDADFAPANLGQLKFAFAFDPGPGIPTDGLRLWLRADSGVTTNAGGAVSLWADRSGNTNDFAQATGSRSPVLNPAAPDGFPAVAFDGVDDSLARVADNGSLDFAEGFLVAVFRAGGAQAGYHAISIRHWGFGFFVRDDRLTAYDWTTGAAHSFGPVLNDGRAHLLAFGFEGAVVGGSRLHVDGGSSDPFTYTADLGSPGVIGSGSQSGEEQFLSGELAELLWYDRKLSPEELAAVRAYAAARYSPGDSDWDGLPDEWESAHGLDPDHWDSDLDGVADGDEDEEGDGMSVAEELLRGTDPGTADGGPGLRYALIDLGTNGAASAMSPGGEWVVGRLDLPGDDRAFRWHAGQIEVFPTNGEAVAVNDSGAAAVNRAVALDSYAQTTEVVRWGPGGTDVVLNGDLDPRAFGQPIYEWDEFSFGAHDIGPDGTVCGSSTTTYIERWWGWENGNWVVTDEAELVMRANTDPHDHWPCRWTQDGTVHLATPPGGTDLESPIGWTGSTDEDVLDVPNWVGVAWRINAAGRMAGTVSFDWYDSPVVRWTASGCTDVPFTDLYMVIDLNDADELLITDGLAGWDPGFELLDAANATLFSSSSGTAAGCNNRGDIAVNPGIPPAAERSVWFSTTNGPAGARRWERASVANLLPAATLEDWGVGGLVAIADNRAIAANATRASDGKERPVLLLPVDIAVDANRDGVIKFAGNLDSDEAFDKPLDRSGETNAFRFWWNEDNDGTGDGEERIGETPDSLGDTIESKRDLEDFARIHLYFGALQDAIKNGQIKVGLKWRGTTGFPSVRIFRSAEVDGGSSYLKQDAAADQQIAGGFGTAIATVSSSQEAMLSGAVLGGLSESNPNIYLLFEGVAAGKGELALTFKKGDGTVLGDGPGVWLDIANIKKMYQRSEGDEFIQPPGETKEAIVFVHGWRMSPEGRSSFAETMFKRLWHRGFKGRFAAFQWNTYWSDAWQWLPRKLGDPIDGYLARYNDSEQIAWLSGATLADFVNALPGDYTKNLAAHSMGNIVAGAAFMEGMSVDNYVLMQAAVPASCYDDREALKQGSPYTHWALPFPIPFVVWDSASPDEDGDGATRQMAYRGRLMGLGGNWVNFYLPQDYATSFAWEINNDATKPPTEDAAFPINYQYRPGNPPGHKLYRFHWDYTQSPPHEVIEYYVGDPFEAMPQACRAWSKAVGAEARTEQAIASSPVNLEGGDFNFDDQHSAQFDFRIQKLKGFYDRLLNTFNVTPNQ